MSARNDVLVELYLADAVFFAPSTLALSDGQGGWWVGSTTEDEVLDRLYCGGDGEAADVILEDEERSMSPNARRDAPKAQASLDFSARPPAPPPEPAAVPVEPESVEEPMAAAPELAIEGTAAADKPLTLAGGEVHRIEPHRLDELRKNIAAINKKIARLGLGEPVAFEVVGRGNATKLEAIEGAYGRTEYRETLYTFPYVEVRLTGKAPVVEGHRISVLLEHRADRDGFRNLIRVMDRGVLDSMTFDQLCELPPHCEHCRLDRRRNTTFMLRKPDGRYIQVGGTCLEDYTRSDDAAMAVQLFSLYEGIIDLIKIEDGLFNDGLHGMVLSTRGSLSPRTVLAVASWVISIEGFMSASKAREMAERGAYARATYHRVVDLMGMAATGEWFDSSGEPVASKYYYKEADIIIEWAIEASAADPKNEYLFNLRSLCTAEFVRESDVALLTSGYAAWERDRAKAAEPVATPEAEADGHVGKPGDSLWMRLYVTRLNDKPSAYGHTYIYGFKTEDGRSLVYFSSRELYRLDSTGNAESKVKVGEWVWLSFTVKSHGEFRGKKDTTITRGKVQSGPEPEKPAKRGRKRG